MSQNLSQILELSVNPYILGLEKPWTPKPWSKELSNLVLDIKKDVKSLPCLGIPHPDASLIVQIDASNKGYGGILLQILPHSKVEQVVRFHSGLWIQPQEKYSTIKKEILSIVLCITKFQDDLINKRFLLRIDCKAAKDVLQKDVKNLVSKHIFARWQSLLSCFDFDIEYLKGDNNFNPDFLTREFLLGTLHKWIPGPKVDLP